MSEGWKAKGRELGRESLALYFACRDPRVPWPAKLLAAAVVAYAFSPIDLIPDFIPVLGVLDDLVLVPLGIWAVRRMIPAAVMQDCRDKATRLEVRPPRWAGAAAVVALWIALAGAIWWLVAK